MTSRVPGVEPEHRALAKGHVGGRKPVEDGHQSVAPGRHQLGFRLDHLLTRQPERCGSLRELGAEEVEIPAERPHPPAHAVALVQVPVGDAREVRPEVGGRLAILLPGHHPGDVGAERDEGRPVAERAGAQSLHGLVVRGRDDRQPGGDAGGSGGLGRHVAGDVARQLELEEHLPPQVELLEECRVVAPLPAVGVDRPLQQDVVGGAVPELAGEAVAEVAGRRRGVRHRRVVGPVGLVRTVVHPADHRLGQRPVCLEKGLAAPDRAQSDGHDLAPVAVESGQRPAARSGDRVPEVVVGMEGDPVPGPAHGPQRLAALGDDVPLRVEDDDLGALRAAVHADQIGARHRKVLRAPPSGRGSRRPRRGCAR